MPDERQPSDAEREPSAPTDAERLSEELRARHATGEEIDWGAVRRANPGVADVLGALQAMFEGAGGGGGSGASPSSNPHPLGLPPGTVIGDFRIERQIGKAGGQGLVFEAIQISLKKRVALKLLKSGTSYSERTLVRFQREAEAGARISHPGLAAVFAFGEADGFPYIAQELVEGGDLREHLEARRDSELPADYYEQTAVLFAELAEALQAAHSAGVIHRDLKPANILLTRDGRPKVVDFGLAKLANAESLSMSGDLTGTWYYMSPEQAMARRMGLDHRTDIFSLGTTLYEALTLSRPFEGDTSHQVAEKIMYADPPDPRVVRSRVPRDLSVICKKAIEKRRQDRYATMADFAADLRRWLADEPIHAKPPGPLRRAHKWVLRHPTPSAVMGLLLATGAVFAWQNEHLQESLTQQARLAGELSTKNVALASALTDAQEQRTRADTKAEEAAENARLASANAEQARREKDNVLRLSAFQQLEDLQREAHALWPATPDRVPAYDGWLARAEALVAGLEPSADGSDLGHRRQLELLRERALPQSEAESLADRQAHPRFAESEAEAAFAQLDASVSERRTYTFADEDDIWWHNQLVKLIGEIEAFAHPSMGLLSGISAEWGWGIGKRREFAARVEDQTLTGDEARSRWTEARASIADLSECPAYEGLVLTPQLGLLPIGADPDSGLWEFWHVQSGDEPQRGPDGKLVLAESMGVVLVLIPGGTFWMGAQKTDPAGQNYDRGAEPDEGPEHEVTLSPYLLSKYELTQGQWQRFTDRNPSSYTPGTTYGGHATTLLHPVEQITWDDAMLVLPRLGLQLPTEAQWERGTRAGTATPWWTGVERDSLKDPLAANLADQAAARGQAPYPDIKDWPELDDGWVVHAAVGRFRANGFGLHDVHGNVWEWCLDSYAGDFYARSQVLDPVNDDPGARSRSYRGGGFNNAASLARSAYRRISTPVIRFTNLGCRPAKGITP